jgi:hypothetical protein
MVAVEVVAAVVLLALAATSTWMGIFGLMGAVGCVRLRRCRECGHLMPSSGTAMAACPYCRPHPITHRRAHARLRHNLPGEW